MIALMGLNVLLLQNKKRDPYFSRTKHVTCISQGCASPPEIRWPPWMAANKQHGIVIFKATGICFLSTDQRTQKSMPA
ncbi:hypothetical protein K1719_004259 [Acacia pycnantha]|nr:hypothetical protein K1719_004259 [Acacia pycnantha]